MKKEPRLLRVLVIHDSDFLHEDERNILGTTDLELFTFEPEKGHSIQRLKRWVDVVEILNVLSRNSMLDTSPLSPPDVLLIDSDFSKDATSPKLSHESYDPRGLLYGAVLAAHFQGSHGWRAFAFSPYSQDMSRASCNPWAQTFYSMLSAMYDALPEIIEADHFADLMDSYKGGAKPSEAVAVVLPRYRDHLTKSFEDYLDPDFGSFEFALAKFMGSQQTGTSPAQNLSLTWRNAQGWVTRILLRSLFADLRPGRPWSEPWNQEEAEPIHELLKRTIEGKNHLSQVLRPTQDILKSLESSGDVDWGSRTLEAKQRRALALTLRWAESRCKSNFFHRQQEEKVVFLYEPLNLEAVQINRALGAVVPTPEKRFQASRYIDMLDEATTWPFDSPAFLPGLVARHLLEGHKAGREELAPEHWPRCLVPFAR